MRLVSFRPLRSSESTDGVFKAAAGRQATSFVLLGAQLWLAIALFLQPRESNMP